MNPIVREYVPVSEAGEEKESSFAVRLTTANIFLTAN